MILKPGKPLAHLELSMNKDKKTETEKKIKELERELKDSTQILNDMQVRKVQAEKELRNLKNYLNNLTPKVLEVSDHAVLRYAERHYSFPFEKIKKEVQEILKGAGTMHNLRYSGFVIKGNTVITYLPQASDGQTSALNIT